MRRMQVSLSHAGAVQGVVWGHVHAVDSRLCRSTCLSCQLNFLIHHVCHLGLLPLLLR